MKGKKYRRRLSILLAVVVLLNQLSGFTVLAETVSDVIDSAYDRYYTEAESFQLASPSVLASASDAVSDIYEEDDLEEGLFVFKKSDENNYYRVYGSIGGVEGFYACDESGELFLPPTALDLNREREIAWKDTTTPSNAFKMETPAELPDYYSEKTDNISSAYVETVYQYVDQSADLKFRVYGTLDGKNEGFYECNSGGELLSYTKLDQTKEAEDAWEAEVHFEFMTPLEVPGYYLEHEITDGDCKGKFTYEYVNKYGNTYYRIYGKLDDANEGFYNADESGHLIKPYEVLDQTAEANNAMGASGSISQTIDEFEPDKAYVDIVAVTDILDGTVPFDDDDSPGNDSSIKNKIVRSFDSVNYTLKLKTVLQNQDPDLITYYRSGDVHVRFELPCKITEAKFDIDSMTWLQNAKQQEETDQDTGEKKVVLTGIRHLQSGTDSAIIPGEATLSVVVKALGVNNEDVIQPEFYVWMEGNEEIQWAHSVADEITVSAAPAYNVQIKKNGYLEWLGTYDFNAVGDTAVNYGEGSVHGRMFGYGITLQVRNANASKGLRGVELPQGEFKFDIKVNLKLGTEDITGTGENQLMPLLWEYKTNTTATTGTQGRNMNWTSRTSNAFNTAPNSSGGGTHACVNSGKWSATQDGDTISFVVDAYEFIKNNEFSWPVYDNSDTTGGTKKYGENLGIGCFSAGYIQILCPFPESVETTADFLFTVSDLNMRATSITGTSVTNEQQTNKKDDAISTKVAMLPKGTYGKGNSITETKVSAPYGNNLSTSLGNQGADAWSAPGREIRIISYHSVSSTADPERYPHAVNVLQKFDDKAFQPMATANGKLDSKAASGTSDTLNYTVLYAAKEGGLGWDSDDEMNRTIEEELEYFPTMAALKAKYPDGVCVAVLIEGRGTIDGGENSGSLGTHLGFNVWLSEDTIAGQVYQTTNIVRIWDKNGAAGMDASYTRLSADEAILEKLRTPTVTVRDSSGYIKTQYDENGNVKANTHAPGGWVAGASLLIVGTEANITKSVDQVSTGKPKVSYDLGASQRRVDYVLNPVLKQAGGKTGVSTVPATVTIIDTLPKGLSIAPGTRFWQGGTYVSDTTPYGGSLKTDEATELFPEVVENVNDGTTKITFVLENVFAGEEMLPIHFSAVIGVVGDEEHDAKNADTFTNHVEIRAERDGRTIHAAKNKNAADYMITIIKLSQSALQKVVKEPKVEVGEPIEYQITHSNDENTAYTDYRMLDRLPYNNDGRGTKFDGTYTTEATLDLSSIKTSGTELTVYASTERYDEKTAADVNITTTDFTALGTVLGGAKETFAVPAAIGGAEVKSVVVAGTLGAKAEYVLTLKLLPENNKVNNVYANDATSSTGMGYLLAPTISAVTVARSLKGVAWYDTNSNGRKEVGEPLLEGVKVSLVDAKNQQPVKDAFGKTVSSKLTLADGSYIFENLLEGSYTVIFESSTGFHIFKHRLTSKNATANQQETSKAEGSESEGVLQYGLIKDIILPAKNQVSTYGYVSDYNNIGFIGGVPSKLTFTGTKMLGGNKTNEDITAGLFKFKMTAGNTNDTTGYTGMPTAPIEVHAGGTQGGSIDFGTLNFIKVGEYTFVLSEDTDQMLPGYQYDTKPVTITVKVTYDRATQSLQAVAAYEKDEEKTTKIQFDNTYDAGEAQLILDIKKILNGRTLKSGEFTFQLKEGAKVIEETNAADGTAVFSVKYTQPGNHTYSVTEKRGSDTNITYDESIYTVEVVVREVEIEGKSGLIADKIVIKPDQTTLADGAPIIFTNVHTPSAVDVTLTAVKALTGRTLKDHEFTFRLQQEDTIVAEAANKNNGSVTFPKLTFTKTGVYHYTVSEVKGSESRITYDTSVYAVMITITDVNGTLVPDVVIQKGDTVVSAITFENRYSSGGGGGDGGGGDPKEPTKPTTPTNPTTPTDPTTPTEPTNPTETITPTTPVTPPNVPGGHSLVPRNEREYDELDENGIPLGTWRLSDDNTTWILDDYVPLAGLAKTGDAQTGTWILLSITGLSLYGIILLRRKKKDS